MRKIVAIILTLTLLAAFLVTPAFAVRMECPSCERSNLSYKSAEEVFDHVTVSSCDYSIGNHTHVYYRVKHYFVCSGNCGEYAVWSNSTARIFCGASNMNMRTINQIN